MTRPSRLPNKQVHPIRKAKSTTAVLGREEEGGGGGGGGRLTLPLLAAG